MKQPWLSRFITDFSFNSVPEAHFWKSEWETFDPHNQHTPVSLIYYCYRFIYMSFFIGAITENFLCHTSNANSFYPIYLTNQTFTLQTIYSTVYFLYMTWVLVRNRLYTNSSSKENLNSNSADKPELGSFHNESNRLPIVCGFLWILINILNVVPYVVTVIYWLFLFNGHKDSETCDILVNLFVHGFNSPLALLDALVVSVPIRITHFVFPFIFAVYYCTFSGLYEVQNGLYNAEGDKEYIYPMLNWRRKPGLALVTSVGALIGAVILHIVLGWGIYRFRLYIKSKCSKQQQCEPSAVP